MRGAAPLTSIDEVLCATSRFILRLTFRPTSRSRDFTEYVANPGAVTVIWYWGPGRSAAAENTPASLVSMDRICPWLAFEMTTFALGTADPVASRTVPEIAATPAAVCANADVATHTNSGRT